MSFFHALKSERYTIIGVSLINYYMMNGYPYIEDGGHFFKIIFVKFCRGCTNASENDVEMTSSFP